VIAGLLCCAVLVVTYVFVFSSVANSPDLSRLINEGTPRWRIAELRASDAYVWLLIYAFNFATAASVLGWITIDGHASGVFSIWLLVAILERNFHRPVWKFALLYVARIVGIYIFIQFYGLTHCTALAHVLASGFVIVSLRVFVRNPSDIFGLGPNLIVASSSTHWLPTSWAVASLGILSSAIKTISLQVRETRIMWSYRHR